MPGEMLAMEKLEGLKKKEREMRILYSIAVDIKAGNLPASYSKKGAELAEKYSGEQLEMFRGY